MGTEAMMSRHDDGSDKISQSSSEDCSDWIIDKFVYGKCNSASLAPQQHVRSKFDPAVIVFYPLFKPLVKLMIQLLKVLMVLKDLTPERAFIEPNSASADRVCRLSF